MHQEQEAADRKLVGNVIAGLAASPPTLDELAAIIVCNARAWLAAKPGSVEALQTALDEARQTLRYVEIRGMKSAHRLIADGTSENAPAAALLSERIRGAEKALNREAEAGR